MEAVMSRKDYESDFQPRKCVRRSCEAMDGISRLPDELIVHILSYLPLKEVVTTGLVSPRWSRLCRYTPNLIFQHDRFNDPMINMPISMPNWEPDHNDRHNCLKHSELIRSLANIEWVNSVLSWHKSSSLKQFTISLHIHNFQVLTRWLHFAFSRRVERLKLHLYRADSILDHNILIGIQNSDCRFLKELELSSLNVSGEAVEFFLRNCTSLERLIIHRVVLKSDLVVGGTLKDLDISARYSVGISVKLWSPNLTRLTCNHKLEQMFFENVPNLGHATFFLGLKETMIQFAKAAAKLEILTVVIHKPVVFPVPQMPKLKKLVFDYKIVNDDFLLPVTALLQASPLLQEFTIKISDLKMYATDFPVKRIFEVPELGRSSHHHLRVFEFSGFCGGTADHLELLTYIVDSCIALEKIIIIPVPAFVIPRRFRKCGYRDFLKGNPYFFWPSSRDNEVAASEGREASLKIKKCTEELLAKKIPHHIKFVVV